MLKRFNALFSMLASVLALFVVVGCSDDDTATIDSSPPTLVSASAASLSHITLTFDEPVDPVTGSDEANYLVYETLVPAVTVSVDTATVNGANVHLALGGEIDAGTHTVRVNGVKDLNGNTITTAQSVALGTQGLTERGEYLVEHVMACGDCHTPRNIDGTLDRTRWLAGAFFADIVPGDDNLGAIYAPNLTPDSTGLEAWTNEEIRNAILNGWDAENRPLFPIMPYWVFHNMRSDDADAVVAYLRSTQAIHNEIPDRQPLGFPFTSPASPIPQNEIPNTTLAANNPNYAAAVRGRYLAAEAGVCIDCHTAPAPGPVPIQLDSVFAGGRSFEIGPPFPALVYSANLTPDDSTGIGLWTPEQIRTLLLTGVDPTGERVCPPMPAGPEGAFGGLTQQDALDIGWYLATIPAIRKNVPDCEFPTISKYNSKPSSASQASRKMVR